MKKRIGSKIYDTDSSELIADVGVGILYRKRTRDREWFMVCGDSILPMTEAEAGAALGEDIRREPEPESKRIMIGVDRETHAIIAEAARTKGVTIAEEVRILANSLL